MNYTLLTDLYQLTMGYGYWQNRTYGREAVFHLFFRKTPFNNPYAVVAGLETAIQYLQNLKFGVDEAQYLLSLKGQDGKPIFDESYIHFLQRFSFDCDIDAMPEGSIALAHEPLMRVRGSLFQCQLVETALLNILNFQTLIATKANRIANAAQGDAVLEFGLRRAQGYDGALSASRAAYIGGCHATSNVLAGMLYGIPVKGTHAHSWVMSHDSEVEAFAKYAEAMPNNVSFLVDTYDTIQGVKNAIEEGKKLRIKGYDLQGIRLDSGDLAALSIAARKLLDDAGFTKTAIVASNDLDEYAIQELKKSGAAINIWGVGTKLVTAYDQPALGGVYKLGAIRNKANTGWDYKIKISENSIKVSNPGVQGVRRYFDEAGFFQKDIIYDIENPSLPTGGQDLLVSIFKKGKLVYDLPDIHTIRNKTIQNLRSFKASGQEKYEVCLDENISNLKHKLMNQKQ